MLPIATAIQMTATPDLKHNLEMAAYFIAQAVKAKTSLIVLPENFPLLGSDESAKLAIKEPFGQGPIQDFLSQQARYHKVWIVGGTLPIQTENAERVHASCLVYDHEGQVKARYDKIHLFDVRVTPGLEEYKESNVIAPGNQVTVLDTPVGKLGLAICYDLRFPELFRALVNQGAEIIAVPAAFTVKTGKAHWEILARSRAIENLVYGVYAGQVGSHSSTRTTYGHSMIINPWGDILQQLTDQCGVISAEIDLNYLKELRQHLPALTHQTIK
jgi:predicted amidohydrolase